MKRWNWASHRISAWRNSLRFSRSRIASSGSCSSVTRVLRLCFGAAAPQHHRINLQQHVGVLAPGASAALPRTPPDLKIRSSVIDFDTRSQDFLVCRVSSLTNTISRLSLCSIRTRLSWRRCGVVSTSDEMGPGFTGRLPPLRNLYRKHLELCP